MVVCHAALHGVDLPATLLPMTGMWCRFIRRIFSRTPRRFRNRAAARWFSIGDLVSAV